MSAILLKCRFWCGQRSPGPFFQHSVPRITSHAVLVDPSDPAAANLPVANDDNRSKRPSACATGKRMNKNEEPIAPLNGSTGPQEKIFDVPLLMRIARRRRRSWMAIGVGIFLISLVLALFAYPQNYSATVSISMQKPDAVSSPLAALTGGAGGAKKYLGVLRSRNFAEKVDRVVHFRKLMGLPDTVRDQDEAIDKVQKDLKLEDNPIDGLLYVTVNLAGPAALSPDPGGTRRSEFRDGVAVAANEYRKVLQDYLKNTDTDKELSLLRAADAQVHKAQVSYAASIDELGSFISHSKVRAVPASTASSAGASDTVSAGTQLSSLYLRKAELEIRMKSTEVMNTGIKSLLNDKQQNISKLPEEDPLLLNARRQVNDAAASLQTLQITYGPSMQSVKRAEEKLRLAEERLHNEVETILSGKTTDQLRRQALQAEYDTVERQIVLAESNFQYNRNMTVEVEKRRNAMLLKLETLKVILTRYAELKLQTVSAQNRMVVIDEARPPRSGKPGMLMLTGLCLFIPFFLVGTWWVVEYLVNSQAKAVH